MFGYIPMIMGSLASVTTARPLAPIIKHEWQRHQMVPFFEIVEARFIDGYSEGWKQSTAKTLDIEQLKKDAERDLTRLVRDHNGDRKSLSSLLLAWGASSLCFIRNCIVYEKTKDSLSSKANLHESNSSRSSRRGFIGSAVTAVPVLVLPTWLNHLATNALHGDDRRFLQVMREIADDPQKLDEVYQFGLKQGQQAGSKVSLNIASSERLEVRKGLMNMFQSSQDQSRGLTLTSEGGGFAAEALFFGARKLDSMPAIKAADIKHAAETTPQQQ